MERSGTAPPWRALVGIQTYPDPTGKKKTRLVKAGNFRIHSQFFATYFMFHVQVRNSTNMIQIQLATPSNAPWCWNIYQHLSSWWPKKAGGDHLAAMLARIHVVRVASMYLMDIGSTCFPAVVLLEWSMNMYTIYHNIWLVVWAPLKNMKVSWDDYSQYMENKKCFKPPTRYRMCIHFCQKSISHMNSLLFL